MAFMKTGHINLLLYYSILVSILCASQDAQVDETVELATSAATEAFDAFNSLYVQCSQSKTSSNQFSFDHMQQFINRQARTTVGLAQKYTGNRKFFANMITTSAFKDMLAKDEDEIWGSIVKKIKYCDSVVMDQELLKEYFARDDLSKL